MHLGKKETSDIALELFAQGESTATFNVVGFHTYDDFLTFGMLIGLNEKAIDRTFKEFENSLREIEELVGRSFLSDGAKDTYYKSVRERLEKRIFYKLKR